MGQKNDPKKEDNHLGGKILIAVILVGLVIAAVILLFKFRDNDSSGSGTGGQDGGLTVVTTEKGNSQENTQEATRSTQVGKDTEAPTEEKTGTKTEEKTEEKTANKTEEKTEVQTEKPSETEKKTEASTEHKEYRFRSKKLLDEHFEKHGIEMGFSDTKAYVAAANDVIRDPASLHKLEKEDGDDVYYRERDNAFVVVSRDGYIRTFFYPNGGKKYFDRQ
ncbi:MAG: hypothetical protein IKN79_10885 [Eubacterium sp.]|nr:hypothetical protein [Eubacterium sp.]